MKQPEKRKKALLDALERTLGIVTPACKAVGISRQLYYEYINTDPEFKKAVEEINEIALDFTETQLFAKIKEGSERSILFYMKYKARKRGYSDTLDINANVSGTIDISKLIGFDDDSEDDNE
jgi:ACT domain-containing protein